MMKAYDEAARCLLCNVGACTKSCKKGLDPSRMIRAVRFENTAVAGAFVDRDICKDCAGDCEKACIHYDFPLRIKDIITELPEYQKREAKDLSIDFLGIHCENPFFLSSSIVASNYEMCAKALDMGWGGIVYKTIGFIRPEEVSPRFDVLRKEGTPFIGFKNLEQISEHDLYVNLDILKRLKKEYPTKIIAASIMGQTDEEWAELARLVSETGTDIIECNFSCPHMSGEGLGSDVGQNPELVSHYTEIVKKNTELPVLAKMTPNIGNMEIPAIAAVESGADGIAAINTIKSIFGVNLDNMEPYMAVDKKSAVSGYSGKAVKPIALRFIHDMAKCPQLKNVPISGMGGIETWHDAAEFILMGCGNIQITTSVMQYGYRIIDDLISGLSSYMAEKNINRLEDMVGGALGAFISPDALDRSTIIYPVIDGGKCIGCGRCYLSCFDAGHQAWKLKEGSVKPVLDVKKCVGCHLCTLVCPVDAIGMTKRIIKSK